VPVIYSSSDTEKITVFYTDEKTEVISGNMLTQQASRLVFKRTGKIDRLEVSIKVKG